jgi:hypothetical protein
LKDLAEKGDPRARWEWQRYLLDLYDFARLTGEAPARALLLRALGGTGRETRGAATTRWVLEQLVAGFEAMATAEAPVASFTPAARESARPAPARSRAAGGALAAHRALAGRLVRLLRSDLAFLRDPDTLPARMRLLKTERRGPATTAAAAALRLYSVCAQAFHVAARAAPADRSRLLSYCLYPLYDFDPTPHLRRTGAPPEPPWTVYREGLAALLQSVARAGQRPAALAGLRAALDRRFFRAHAARLPVLLHDQAPDLPTLLDGRPYRGASALVLRADQLIVGGRSVLRPGRRHFRVALTEAFFAGNRGTQLTLFAPSDLPMGKAAPLLERAAATGFYEVGLGGIVESPSQVGYWRLARGPAPIRLREVVVSLAPISAAAATLVKLSPAKLGWDRACARDALGVLLAPREATPYGPDGRLPPQTSPRSTWDALYLALRGLADAFPTACAVRIAADPKLPYADFLATLATLRAHRGASATWRWVGYALPPGPPPANATFAGRVSVRLAAKVKLLGWPRGVTQSRDDLTRRLRPCYLEALDTTPARWGRFEVHSAADKTLVSQVRGTSPEELSLNGCLARAVEAWRKAQSVDIPCRFFVHLKP